jgi:hypothetical protein
MPPSSLYAILIASGRSLELVSLWRSSGPVLWALILLSLTILLISSGIEDVYSYNFPRDNMHLKLLGMQIPYYASCFSLTYLPQCTPYSF